MQHAVGKGKAFEKFIIRRSSETVYTLHALRTEDRHACEFIVKLTCVQTAIDVRRPGRRNFASHQFVEI